MAEEKAETLKYGRWHIEKNRSRKKAGGTLIRGFLVLLLG